MRPASAPLRSADEVEPKLPEDMCQVRITLALYADPLLWVCMKRDRKAISAVISRWANAQNIRERLAHLIPRPGPRYQLLYTVPPMNIPKFPGQLSRETGYDVKKQDIHFTFAYFPPARCSFCGEFGTQLPQVICNWCQASPTYHHHECCPYVNLEIREKLRRKHQEVEQDTEDSAVYSNVPPKRPWTSGSSS